MKYYLYGQEGINDEVINHYLSLIERAIKRYNDKAIFQRATNISEITNDSTAIYYVITDAIRSWIKNRRPFYIWMQGVYPEERLLRKGNKLDYYITSIIEYFILRKAKKIFMVSDEMLSHYENKYKLVLKNKTFIMPCYNCELDEEAFRYKDKYNNLSFCYVGSLANWQCFDDIVLLYKKVENRFKEAKFYIFTKEVDNAKKILLENNIKNYEVSFVPSNELANYLKKIKYGFILREDIAVNWVATPTKLSNYLSCGIIPIFSNYLHNYNNLSKRYKYLISLESNNDINRLIEFEDIHISESEVLNEYSKIFEELYSDEKNIDNIAKFLSK